MKNKEYHIDGDGNPIHFEPVKVAGVKKAYKIVEGLTPPDISYSEKRKKIRKQRKAKNKLLKKQKRKEK